MRLVWQKESELQTFTLDASVRETHSYQNAVTEHPVEKGIDLSDHIRPEATQLTIEGVVTNTPIKLPPDFADGAQQIQTQVQGRGATVGNTIGRPIPIIGALTSNIQLPFTVESAYVTAFDIQFNRVQRFLDSMNFIRGRGILVSVYTSLSSWENMAVVSLNIPRDAQSGSNALQFTLQLKEVRIGVTREVPAPTLPTARTNKGTKVPKPAKPDPESETEGGNNTLGRNLKEALATFF